MILMSHGDRREIVRSDSLVEYKSIEEAKAAFTPANQDDICLIFDLERLPEARQSWGLLDIATMYDPLDGYWRDYPLLHM